MSFGCAVAVDGAHGELGDFVIECNETFNDHPALIHAGACGSVVPGRIYFRCAIYFRLPLAGGRHHRLDDAGKADDRCRGAQFFQAVGEFIRRGRQAQRLGSKTADAFAVHGELRGACGGNHARQAFLLDFHQHAGGDGFDLRHDEVRTLLFDECAQRCTIRHVDDMRTVRHLMPRRIGVAIHCDGFHAQTLQRDDNLLAEFAAAQQHDSDCGRTKRRADGELCFHASISLAIIKGGSGCIFPESRLADTINIAPTISRSPIASPARKYDDTAANTNSERNSTIA